MKCLIGIPCLFGSVHTKAAIDSVINQSNVLLIDNGAEKSVRSVIDSFDCHKIHNKSNLYVNQAWNQILDFFLKHDYDILVIMNSDIIMNKGWIDVLSKVPEGTIAVPNLGSATEDIDVNQGTPGVFIHLTKKQANIVYPITDCIKVWFGDNWIYGILRSLGYKTVVYHKLKAIHYHNGSQNVSRVNGISEIIEEDKRMWAEKGVSDMNGVIEKHGIISKLHN